MKLGIYIGSFNPPHKGHIYVVRYLLDNNYVNKILIVPTANYWDKQNLVDIKHRINMLKFYETDIIKVDDINNGYAYTYQLMRKLKEDYPSDSLYLILGADNISNFDKWKNYEELLKYNIIIMNRNGIDIDKYISNYPNGNFTIARDFVPIDVSSSDIRNGINEECVDEKVYQYVKKHGLYR